MRFPKPERSAGSAYRFPPGLRALGAVALLLTGCLVGPKYQAPSDPLPQSFKENRATDGGPDTLLWAVAQPNDGALRGKWWEVFQIAELNEMEDQLDINNQNIKQFFENFMAARALIAQARAQYWPTVGVGFNYTRSYGASGAAGAPGGQTSLFSLPIDVAWTPDFWGKVRNQVRESEYAAQMSAADLENERLTEQAALAQYYFELHGQDALLEILEQTVAADQKALDYNRAQFETGIGTEIALVEAQNSLETAQAAATHLGIARATYEHAIAMLMGRPASTFSVPPRPLLMAPPPIPVALPSQLLERRPDIAAAERNMAAANAQIGVAYGAYYPNFTLSLTGGVASSNLGSLFAWPSRFWSVGPGVSETIFDGGLRRATVNQFIATYNANLATYRQTVLVAFQQVEDQLATVGTLSTEIAQERRAVDSAEKYVRLEEARYQTGVDPYVDVVIALNALLSAQQTLAQLQITQMMAAVQLIENLGGGWDRAQLPTPDRVSEAPKDTEVRIQR